MAIVWIKKKTHTGTGIWYWSFKDLLNFYYFIACMLDYIWMSWSEESVFLPIRHDHKWIYLQKLSLVHHIKEYNSKVCHGLVHTKTADVPTKPKGW